jgi:hypothetical protein
MAESLPALQRLSEIEAIQASFVFDDRGTIIGREVPGTHTDGSLTQVALRFLQALEGVKSISSAYREARFEYENYGIWLKPFGENLMLVVFYSREADVALLRQPVNIAVLNLSKMLQGSLLNEEDEAHRQSLIQAARAAEAASYQTSGSDTNGFFAKLTVLTTGFFGPVGSELLEWGCREKNLHLPLEYKEDVDDILAYVLKHVPDAWVKETFLKEAEDLTERLMLRGLKAKNAAAKAG